MSSDAPSEMTWRRKCRRCIGWLCVDRAEEENRDTCRFFVDVRYSSVGKKEAWDVSCSGCSFALSSDLCTQLSIPVLFVFRRSLAASILHASVFQLE